MLPPGCLVHDVDAPELGVGRVLRCDEELSSADVLFAGADQPRVVRDEPGGNVRRLRLHVGQGVRLATGGEGEVLAAEERREREAWTYKVRAAAGEVELPETQLEPLPPRTSAPLDQLRALRWRGGWRAFARWNLQDRAAGWEGEAEGIPAWFAARRPPGPAALLAARQVLWARAPRFLVALPRASARRDVVGLTLLALLHERPELPVLVVAPGVATRGWVERLYVDFGGHAFAQADLRVWEELEQDEREELLARERLVVSAPLLASRPEARAALGARSWGLVVIDEAHLYGGELAAWLRARSDAAGLGCLALCPPPRAEDEQLPALLELTAPGAGAGLAGRAERARPLANAALALARGDGAAAADLLASCADPLIAAARPRLAAEEAARAEVLAQLRRHYRLDPRLLAQAPADEAPVELVPVALGPAERAVWEHFAGAPQDASAAWQRWLRCLHAGLLAGPERFAELLDLREGGLERSEGDADPGVLAAWDALPAPNEAVLLDIDFAQALAASAPASKGERAWLTEALQLTGAWEAEGSARRAAAVAWIEEHLAEGGGSVLLVVPAGEVHAQLAEELGERLGPEGVAACHELQDEVERAEALRRLRESPACCVLVSDAAGAEGIDVEVVLRLGRALDPAEDALRYGPPAARAVYLQGDHPREAALTAAWAATDGAGAELARWGGRARATAAFFGEAAALAGWAAELASGADPFAALHDLAAADLEETEELADALEEATIEGDAAELKAWARCLRIKLRSEALREWTVSWRPNELPRRLVGLEREHERARARGTFDPLHAREHPALALLAPGHPLIDALVRDVHAPDSDGRLTVVRRDLGAWPGRLALVVIARCGLGAEADALPAGLRRRARRRLWPEPYAEVVSLHPGDAQPARPVTDRARRNVALAPFVGREVEPKVEADVLCDAIGLQRLSAAVEAGVQLALERVKAERASLSEDAAEQLAQDLAGERACLEGLIASGDPGAREALARHDALLAAIRAERFEVDALLLLVG
ncbi:MAG: hypothetical protein AB7N76_33660 [Planctomycetota bacterium]